MSPVAIVIWVVLIALVVLVLVMGMKNKWKYKGRSMEATKDWLEASQSKASSDTTLKSYFFHYDKHYFTQGHLMEDRNNKVVYEAKILYGNPIQGYEVDFTNFLNSYMHHHKITNTTTTELGEGGFGVTLSSYFKFDGEKIWQYLKNLGYTYNFVGKITAPQIEISKDGIKVGTIYSSNAKGSNYFGAEGPIVAKIGSQGFYVVECADKDIDIMFLWTMAFTRTEWNASTVK